MTNDALRAGIIGAGLTGRWHAHAAARAGGRVTAVTDLDPAAARRLAAGHAGAEAFPTVESMLERGGLDVLHLCTPPPTHREIAGQGIEAGISLLVEKPLAATAVETDALYQRAARAGVLLCPVHQFVFQDGALEAREVLSRIGRLLHVAGTFCSAGGGGRQGAPLDLIAGEILPHPLSLFHLFAPEALAAAGWMTAHPGHGELRALGEAPGLTLSLFVSLSARPTVCAFTLLGTEGAVHLDLFHGYALAETGAVSRAKKVARPFDLAVRGLSAATVNLAGRALRREPAYPGLRRLIGSFYGAVRAGSAPPISREDALAVARSRDLLMAQAGIPGG